MIKLVFLYLSKIKRDLSVPPHRSGFGRWIMKSTGIKIITALSVLFLLGFSLSAHSETDGVKQEKLGRAIQQAALVGQQAGDMGAAQEMLGQAIQQTTQVSSRITAQDGKLQEQLGQQIRDAAVLQYAQGRTQEKIAGILLQMAKS